jgi:hypothetical protein
MFDAHIIPEHLFVVKFLMLEFSATDIAKPFLTLEQEGGEKPPASIVQVALFRWPEPTFKLQ